ncbi:MAG TPA: class I SAM-dependent methyltransferase [Leptospiraceae bacterium]|nr:class I SAM-dependent methyltransferase [Leptospiraceae bacterium]HNL70250.1 class I SAM-dependent methyltransferase [Leptospiraceae bacterium]
MSFKDHFSNHSRIYSEFRPDYPDAFIEWVCSLPEKKNLAWDCGTGSGQAAVQLKKHFNRVIATDPSEEQIKHAKQLEGIEYRVLPAEKTNLDTASMDLICVAQALHWFDFDLFFAEARRVLKPRGILCAWSYGLLETEEPVQTIIESFYRETVGPYWPAERRHVDERYATIPFPFYKIEAPYFQIERTWDMDSYLGYVSTWSAVQRMRKATGIDPLIELRNQLRPFYPGPLLIRWPIFALTGRAGNA